MNKRARILIVAALGLAGTALAAEQTILGTQFQVKNPGAVAKRKFLGLGREKGSTNTLVGDPTVSGATLEVFANGATSTTQTFDLPASGWSARGRAFNYKGASGAVRVAQLKIRKGKFLMKVLAVGKGGLLDIVPPNPGSSGCFAIAINGGDRYSVDFGATSKIKNKGTKLFLAQNPTAEAACPTGVGSASPSFVFLDPSGLF